MPPQHRSSRAAREESPHRKPFSASPSPRSVKTAFPAVNTPVLRKPRHNSENQPPENVIHNTGKGSIPFGDAILTSPALPPAKSTPAKGKQHAGSHSLPPRPPAARPSPSNAATRNVPEAQGNAKRKLLLETPNSGDVATNYSTTPDLDTGVKVIVRMRPCNQREESDEASPIAERLSNDSLCIADQQFTFDYVAGQDASQKTMFEIVGVPLVENCLQGLNSSIFAYGQTGSGKTYTMWGSTQELLAQPPSEERGLTPRVFEKLFQRIREEEKKNVDKQLRYQCRCSFLEIYNEQITDLLDPVQKSLQVREDTKVGVYVENLTEEFVSSVEDVFRLILKGLSNRKVASTCMNLESSRSHTLFMCVIESRCKSVSDGLSSVRTSRMNLVDLAGSERQKLTGAAGERLKEAGNINRSLSQLGNLINILAEVSQTGKVRHIPYRDSRLTFLLQESLGGNAKLAMICAISPASSCKSETLSTLRFAQRAKSIKNKAVINEETENDVKLLREQIKQLKDELMRMKTNETSVGDAGSYSNGWNARRSYNLLRMSLTHHPMTLPHSDTDTDEEMEIDEDAVENVDASNSPAGMDIVKEDNARHSVKDNFEFPKGTGNDTEAAGICSMPIADITLTDKDSVASEKPCDILSLDNVIMDDNTDAAIMNGVHIHPLHTLTEEECSVDIGSGTPCVVDPPEADEVLKSSEEASQQEAQESVPDVESNIYPLEESVVVDFPSDEVDNNETANKDDSSSDVPETKNITVKTELTELACEHESNTANDSLNLGDGAVQDSQDLDTPTVSQCINYKETSPLEGNKNVLDVQIEQIEYSVYASAEDVLQSASDCNTLPSLSDTLNIGSTCSTPNVGSRLIESNDFQKEVVKCKLNTNCDTIVHFSEISDTPEPTPPLRSPILSISPYLATDVLEAPILSISPRIQDDTGKNHLETMLPPNKLQDSKDKKPPLRSSFRKSKNLSSPTDKLAESLHKGLQILESHQRKDSTNRMSMVNFSFQTLDWEKPKTKSVVSKSVQTSPVASIEKAEKVLEAQEVPSLSLEPSEPNDSPVSHVNEAILAAALRRERALEECLNQKITEIEQLNRLVGQYKHERECNALLQQSREDKISRLERLMEGTIPTDAFLSEEWTSLATEHKILQDKYDHHPDVTLASIREKKLEEDLQKYKNFYDLGEKEILLKEISQLRDQLESLVGVDANKQRRRESLVGVDANKQRRRESLVGVDANIERRKSLTPVTKVTVEDVADASKVDTSEEKVESGCCSSCQENEERWLEREEEWKLVLEELRIEVQEYKNLADKRKRELEGQHRCSDEMKDALQIAMEGHARLLDQYAELQEKHISLLSKHRKVKDAMTDVKKKAGKMGFLGGKFFEAQAAELIALKMEQEQEREEAREQIEALQAQVRDTADAVQAAGELLVRLKEAEESALIAQDAAALAAEDVEKLCREMDKLKRRHATEVATLQQRLMEVRFQKSKVCPMCVMAERAKYEFNGVDEQDANAALEDEGAVASSFGSFQLPTAEVDDEPYYYEDEEHELSLQGIDDFHTEDADDRWYHEDETCNL